MILNKFNSLISHKDPKIHDFIQYESDIKLLHEKNGYKLFFASSVAHGYFGLLYPDDELILVGEEDEGIDNKEVKSFFGINQYGDKK